MAATGAGGEPSWQDTIARISPAVVNVRMCRVRSVEGKSPSYSFATGFVVDKARGIILSNRHVVGTGEGRRVGLVPKFRTHILLMFAGPSRNEAVFLNKEEVDLIPIYRDPIHDFGEPSACSAFGPSQACTDKVSARRFLSV